MAVRKQNHPTAAALEIQESYWKAIAEKREQELKVQKAAWNHLQEIDLPQLEERIREQARLKDEIHAQLEEEAWIDPRVTTPEERQDPRLPSKARAGKEYSFYIALLRKIKNKSVFVSGLYWYYGGEGWKIPWFYGDEKNVIVLAYRTFKKPAFMGEEA